MICLRHGEKPENADHPDRPPGEDGPGLDERGRVCPHSLTIKGWQRAGALAATNVAGQLAAGGDRPRIFVPDYGERDESHRTWQTVRPLSRRWHLGPRHPCNRDDVPGLIAEISTLVGGTAIVCWAHEGLSDLVEGLIGHKVDWPDDRFDVLWLVEPNASSPQARFRAVDQRLLPGDCGLD